MRKRSVVILLACLVLITAANAIMLAETNLALNKAATASSIQGTGYEAAKAVDGNTGTRWSANFTGDPQWIYVDLGATYDINRVVLRWETAYGKAYQIQVSSNASSWTDVYATTTGDGGVDDINFTTTSARYVRMYGTQRGTSYSYSLWEFEVYGGSSDTQAPTVPTNLTATAVSSSQINLSWTASTDNVGVTGYRIYRGGAAIATTAGTSYSDSGLSPNTTYSYTVSAYDAANNESGQSAPASATTPATTYDDEFSSGTLDAKWSWVRQNAANWSLTARAGYMRIIVEAGDLNHNPADNKNTLLQTAPSGDWTIIAKLDGKPSANWVQAGLIVYQDDSNYLKLVRLYCDGNTFQFAKEVGGAFTEQRVTDSIASTTSYLKIAKSGNNYSGYYSADGITYTQVWTAQSVSLSTVKIGLMACNGCTSGGPTMNADFDWFHIVSADSQPPTVPTGLTATPASCTQIDLSWTASTDNVGVAGYYVYRDSAQIANVTSGTSYNDTGRSPNTTYSYTVAAYDGAGNTSAQCAAVNATTPADTQAPTVPTGLTATAVSSTQIDLSWTASSDNVGVTGYRIYRGGAAIATTAGTAYSDTGLTPGTSYTYTVSAFDAANNESAQSAAAGATTPANTYDDEFASGTLDAKWSWVRQNAPNWSLTAAPGYMRIVVEAGDLNHNPADNKNMLVQTAPAGDWTITTKLTGKPAANWVQAGLIVYQDDSNYLKLVRLYCDGNTFQFAKEVGGTVTEQRVTDSIASPTCYLKITKSGNNYSGYYSADDITYTQVWTAQSVSLSTIKIGLMACNGCASGGPTMNADFDWFRLPAGGGGGGDTQAPTVPTGLTASAVSSSQINLSWTASTDNVGVTGYKIFRDGNQVATTAGTTYSDTGLSPSTTYTYAVSAYDAAGNNSAQSSPASATTQAPSGFWKSGGSRNTNLQSSTYEWANFRGRACTFQTVYTTRNAGWDAFVSSHGTSGQIADFTDPSIEIMIQTAPFPENTGSTYAALISGAYDSYWRQIGTLIKNREASGKPTIISIAWEMNGTYMYWGGGGGGTHYSSPSEYIAGYRRIVDQLRVTYPQVRTAWIINAHATPTSCEPNGDAWGLYPGDAYVTYVGTDNYDHYPPAYTKTDFDNIANANGGLYWLANLAAQHGKQVIVGEWGIAPGSGTNGGGDNANFIQWMWDTFQAWQSSGRIYAEYYFADPIGGGNVDSDLIDGNPNSRAKYISLW